MRRAKQNRSDTVAERAQRMASDRYDQIANDLNQKTNDGLERSMEANRHMLKEEAMQNSVLGRQGVAIEQTNQKTVEAKVVFLPRDNYELDRSLVGRRREQVEPGHGDDSLPPGFRRVMQRDVYHQRNTPQPKLLPQAHPDPMQVMVQSSRPAAFGLTQNPIEDTRRRRKLEAKIRELASK